MKNKITALLNKLSSPKAPPILFMVLFAIIGTALLLNSFASMSVVVEGESLTYQKSARTGAPSGTAAALYWGTTGTTRFNLSEKAVTLSIGARGDQCKGAPRLIVTIDGRTVIFDQLISSSAWKTYTVPVAIGPGNHSLGINFPNDYYAKGVCDRNLYLDRFIFTGASSTAPAPPAKPRTYTPGAAYNMIVIGWHTDQESLYANLANSKTNLTYRSIAYDKNDKDILRWESSGQKYFYMVAASDFMQFQHKPLYVSQADGDEVLARPNSSGLYIHELMTYRASTNGWNWPQSADQIDWGTIDHWVMTAKAKGKKVVWSEPALAWPTLQQNASAQNLFRKWGDTLVPMFATNFDNDSAGHLMGSARSGAAGVASTNGMPLGESVQSWYFAEQDRPEDKVITPDKTVQLFNFGAEKGASYYEIEGTYEDMDWSKPYMQGVLAFSRNLEAGRLPALIPPRNPVYQMWNSSIVDHYYPTNNGDQARALGNGYQSQEIAGYVDSVQTPGTVPLYEMYSTLGTDHYYTTDPGQRDSAAASFLQYGSTRVIGYIPAGKIIGTKPFYQLWTNGYDGAVGNSDHFYTTDQSQKTNAINSFYKYQDQGVAGYLYSGP